MTVSKAMEEVRRWKEEVARLTEGMTAAEQIAYFRQASQRLAEKTGKKLDLRRASRRGK
jgi:hypothetical protein